MLTPAATRFVGPLSFAALSRHPVETELLDLLPDGRIGHIVVADTADAIVVAPATAHWLGAMAGGLAGDVVTATTLATSAPVVVAPAMDGDMWTHPATVANVARLRGFGYTVVEPDAGPLASGQIGRRAAGRAAGHRRCRRGGRRRSPGPCLGSGRPPTARRTCPRRRPGRPPHRRDRRRDARGDRPGPFHRQPLDRQDGRRDRRGRPRPRGAGHGHRRERRGPLPARRHGRPGRVDRRPARRAPPRDTRRRRRGRLRCAGDGGGGRGLPAGDPGRHEARCAATR